MHGHEDNYTFLTQAPVHKVILTMSLPTIVSMLVTSLYNVADAYFVGQINTQATAAVGVAFSMMFFVQAVGFFFGHGSGNFISRELGARRHASATKMASTGFLFSFVSGVAILILGELFVTLIADALGSTPTIQPYAEKYLRILFLGAPFLTSSLTLNNQMRLQGNASFAMYGIVVGAVLNIILDPLLIFGMGWGISGAAWATVVGQATSFVILLFMARRGENIAVRLRNFSPSWQFCKEIFYGGSPSLSRQGLASVAAMMLNVVAGGYGDSAIAGLSIVSRISMLVLAVVIGIGQGFQPLCGFCYGAGMYKRLREAYFYTVRIGTVFLILCAAAGWMSSGWLISVFRDDPEVVSVGVVALRWQLCTYPLNAFVIASNMLAQTCRKPWRANFLAAARQGLFFIPLILILPGIFGILGVEMCQAVSDAISFLATIPIMIYTFREFSREEKHSSRLSDTRGEGI